MPSASTNCVGAVSCDWFATMISLSNGASALRAMPVFSGLVSDCAFASILKPPLKRPVLFVGEGRVQVVDGDVGRGDQYRLGVGERVEAILAVIVAHPGGSGAAERHGLDEQVNVHQVHPAPAVRQLADEPVDGLLVAAEDETSKRVWRRRDSSERLVKGLVGEDRRDWAENLILHDLVVPCDGIKKR